MPTARKPPKRAVKPSPEPEVAPSASPVGRRWEFAIDRWRPVSLNELLNVHWATAATRKKRDRRLIGAYFRMAGIPEATGKRRVSLVITIPKGQRRWDEDNLHKSLADALKHAKAIVNDSPAWIAWGPIDYVRPGELSTKIILEEVQP